MTIVVSGATGPSDKSWIDGDGDGNGGAETGGDDGDETVVPCAGAHPPKISTRGIEISAVKAFICGNLGHVSEREDTRV